MAAAMAGMAAATALGALGQYEGQRKADRRAKNTQRDLDAEKNRILGIEDPDLQGYERARYTNEFDFTPEEIEALQQEQSSLGAFEGDPRLRDAQMAALSQMGEYTSGDLTEGDKAAMAEAQLAAGTEDRGRQEAILQSMARRGQAGGGQELAARLSSSQGASDRAAADNRTAVQGAQQRALQAILNQSQMSKGVRGQDFGEAESRAAAADRINRFNTQNKQGIMQANVAARNAAANQAARNRQRLSEANVGVTNQQRGEADRLAQAKFGNLMQKEGVAKGIATSGLRGQEMQAGQDERAYIAKMADLGGQGAHMGAAAYDEKDDDYYKSGGSSTGGSIA